MKQTLAIICGLLFIVLPGAAQSKNSQDKTTDKAQTDKAQIVATAEVTKIDAKKKTIQVRNLVDSPSTSSTDRSTRRPGGGGGSPTATPVRSATRDAKSDTMRFHPANLG